MKLETFFEKFDLFADAPDSVAKMRSLILQLAMQGNLSEPHENDRPIEDLLQRIKEERAALGLKDSAGADSCGIDYGTLNEIPERWTWISFGHLARHNAGKTLDKGRNSGELRDYITTSNLYWGFFQLNDVRQMPIQADELERCTATQGDLLIVEGGEAGRAAVWSHDYDICFQNHIHRARFFAEIDPYFIQRYFEKLNASGEIALFRKGVAISNMSGKALASIPIPLPPLAEQKRIVAKVDELMALCDRLEAQQQERETRHAALARASLSRFAEAPTVGNLHYLFQDSVPIPPADLRKAILTLAVQGKLVPQAAAPSLESLDSILAEASVNGVSKGPTSEKSATEILRISAGTSRDDFYVNEDDFKHVDLPPNEIEKFKLAPGDLLACRFNGNLHYVGRFSYYRGNSGRVQVNPDKLIRFRIKTEFHCPRYVCLAMNAAPTRQAIEAMCATTAGNIGLSAGRLKTVEIPLPPLAEQRRIVAKVEQLTALVDALETQLAASRATAAKLLSALVAELTGTKSNGKVSKPAASGPARRGRTRKST